MIALPRILAPDAVRNHARTASSILTRSLDALRRLQDALDDPDPLDTIVRNRLDTLQFDLKAVKAHLAQVHLLSGGDPAAASHLP